MTHEPSRKPVIHTRKHIARLERERRQSRLVLFTFIGILTAVILLVGYGLVDIYYLQLRRPVAIVGGVEIPAGDFEARVRLQRRQLLANYNLNLQYSQMFGIDTTQQIQQIETYLNSPELLGQTVLDQMIDEELIRQEAVKRGITTGPDELDEFIQAEFGYFPNGTYTPTTTPTSFEPPPPPAEAFDIVSITPTSLPTSEATSTPILPAAVEQSTSTPASGATLESNFTATATLPPTATATIGPTATITPTATVTPTATPYTFEGFQGDYNDALKEFAKSGLSEPAYRTLVENQVLRNKLRDLVLADIGQTEEQVWARHILVSDSALAATLIQRLMAGEDFGQLATEFSEDTGSAASGGDLGWFGKGAMVAEFETAAFALGKPGDYTLVPVQSQFGYHIIQLIARQERPLGESEYQQARATAFDDWLASLREEYAIETFDDFWKQHVPAEPDFSTLATEAVDAAKTRNAESQAEATATPK